MNKIMSILVSVIIRVFKNDSIRAWAIKHGLKLVNAKIKETNKNKRKKGTK